MGKKKMSDDKKVKDVQIVHQGHQIILPVVNGKPMPLADGIDWLKRKMVDEERDVQVHHELACFPLDGAVAFHRAMSDKYGWTEAVPTPGFFGDRPPTMVGVKTGPKPKDKVQVPWGRIEIPGITGYLVTAMADSPPRFVISGVVKKKHMPDVQEIVNLTEEKLKTHSIYRGQAIELDFGWVHDGDDFDPQAHCPKFMDLAGVSESDLVFSEEVTRVLELGLYTPLDCADAVRAVDGPIRFGVLLYGPWGTGKSLTMTVAAVKAVRNGFTFINLNNPRDVTDVTRVIEYAEQYAPAVVAFEDADRFMAGERTAEMDAVLNNLSGVKAKGKELIVICTTNHVERINQAFLRQGRISRAVRIDPPDAEAAVKLVKLFGGDLLSPDVDYKKLGKALAGRVPVFIEEAVKRAKVAAVGRLHKEGKLPEASQVREDLRGQVLEVDIINAAAAMEAHAELLREKEAPSVGGPEVLVRVPEGNPHVRRIITAVTAGNGNK